MTAAAPASTPQVGWLTTSTPGSRKISRPTMNFCRLPPDRLTASGSRLALRTSKALGGPVDGRQRRRPVDEAALHHAAGGVAGEQRVFRQFHARRGAVAEPLLRHESGAQPAALGDRQLAGGVAVDDDVARDAATARSPDSAANNSSWPLPATPAMPRISPPLTSSETSWRCTPCGSSGSSERSLIDSRGTVRGAPARRFHLADFGADHHPRQRRRGFLARIAGRYLLAAAQDGRGVAQPLHLVQLVADVEDGAALARAAARARRRAGRLPAA